MKQLVILLKVEQWVFDFRDFLEDYWILLLIAILLFMIANQYFEKKNEKEEFDYIHCDGLIKRGDMISYRKNVLVRIHKMTKAYHFQDVNKKWYQLGDEEIKEIKNSKGELKFTIPKDEDKKAA